MRTWLTILSVAVALAACEHVPGGPDQDFSSELAQPDRAFAESPYRYYGIEEGTRPTFEEVRVLNFPEEGASESGVVRVSDSGTRRAVDVISANQEDDSVEASHVRFLFSRSGQEWRLDKILARYRCYRGRPGVWTDGLCP